MDRMAGPKEAIVTRGMSSLHAGLGMLLGTGRISAATHDHILSLIHEEAAPGPKDDDGEKPPGGHARPHKDPPSSLARPTHGPASARREEPKPGHRKPGAGSADASSSATPGAWHSAIPETPLSSQDGSASEPPVSSLVCPWYSTAGYHCREQRQGKCAWLHESSAGAVAEPLICSFWAESMCIKTAEDCRFAHYWARHRQIAPTPGSRFKRQKPVLKPGWP